MSENTRTLRFNRQAIYKPSVTRQTFRNGGGAYLRGLEELDDTNIESTASFRYDPVGTGLKSTQQLQVDFSDFSKHTFFNSAEAKVNVAFETIFNEYPFDGTRLEVEAFFDNRNGFEKYVFDQFPKNKGYLKFENGSFIEVIDHAGNLFPTIARNQSGRSVLDPGLESLTFEMHLYVPPVTNENQVILQKQSGSVHGVTLGLVGTNSTDTVDLIFGVASSSHAFTLTGTIPKGEFTHIAATYDRRNATDKLFLYKDSALLTSSSTRLKTGQIDFSLSSLFIGTGSAIVSASDGETWKPAETLSGAIDELRVFHDVRSERQLTEYARKNIFTQPKLKLYFKFNEPTGTIGETTGDSLNRLVLDSSGNSLSSYIDATNFSFDLRNTSSVPNPMTEERLEYNPVLFSTYNDIVKLNNDMLFTASCYDEVNPNLITKLVPQHYFLEGKEFEALTNVTGTIGDTVGGTGVPGQAELGQPQLLAALLYVVANEFDEVKMFLDAFGNSLYVNYDEFDTAPDQLLKFLASYKGVELPGFFSNASFQQYINAQNIRSDFSQSELALQDIQNQLWRRILTNLNDIMRSKGTLHSVKAFIRAIGIDPDQNFRIREYGGMNVGNFDDYREDKASIGAMLDMSGSTSFIQTPHLIGTQFTGDVFPE